MKDESGRGPRHAPSDGRSLPLLPGAGSSFAVTPRDQLTPDLSVYPIGVGVAGPCDRVLALDVEAGEPQ